MRPRAIWSVVLVVLMIGVPFAGTALAAASDSRDAATPIAALPFTDEGDSNTASTESDDPYPRCGNNNRARSVWYSFTPSEGMNLDARVDDQAFNAILSVWTEVNGTLRSVACNDNHSYTGGLSGFYYNSRTFFQAEAGTEYLFMISSYDGNGGTFTFSLQEAPNKLELGVTAEDKGWVNAASGNVTITGEIACSRPATTVALRVTVTQRVSGERHERYGYDYVDCENNNRWLITVRGDFKNGKAEVASEVSEYDAETGQQATASDNINAELRVCTMIGTLGNDTMRGTDKADSICSLAGDDTIYGAGGNDKLRGHDGDDMIVGGAGDDLLTGGYGSDRLKGGAGSDTIYGDAGNDAINGGKGSDRCRGSEGRNTFRSCERKF